MKTKFGMKSGLFVALGVAALAASPALAAPSVGAGAPSFSGPTSEGTTIDLSDFEGQKVILEWTNKDCPFVRKHYDSGNMQSVQSAAADAGYAWIQVISSAPGKQGHLTPEQANAHAADVGAAVDAIVIDEAGDVGRLFDATATPQLFVLDESHTIRYMGAIDDKPSAAPSSLTGAKNYVLAAISAIEAGEEVETTETSAYGCSVKY